MTAEPLSAALLIAIEIELHRAVGRSEENGLAEFDAMLSYHLGWEGPGAGPEARGKRIRPLLVVLTCAAACGDWEKALPPAAAVELVHNFSLIHDDIQDNSPLRRGRETIWKRWGVPRRSTPGRHVDPGPPGLLRTGESSTPESLFRQQISFKRHACI
jgi:geranylgeranyl diphosphate synthase type I